MRLFILAAAAAASLLAPSLSPATAQSREVDASDGPYVHKSVGISFPAQAGDFERTRIVEFNNDGSDASVGYSRADMPAEITLYVYPSSGVECAAEHEGAKAAIINRNGTLRPQADNLYMPGFELAQQLSSTYDIPAGGYGFDHPALVSYLWIGCVPGGKWLVKYRGSFFASQEEIAKQSAANLFSQLDWKPMAKFTN